MTSDDTEYLLVNVYNANTEQEQLKTLQNLSVLLENVDNFCSNNVISAGDFMPFSVKSLNVIVETHTLKNTQQII